MGTFDNEKPISERVQKMLDNVYGAENSPAEVVKALRQEFYFIDKWNYGDISPEHVLQVCREHEFRVVILDAVDKVMFDTVSESEEGKTFKEELDKVEDSDVSEQLGKEVEDLKKKELEDWRTQHSPSQEQSSEQK